MSIRFDETVRGVKFFDRQLPDLIKAIEKNTAEMKRANDLKEKELEQTEKLFGIGVIDGEPEPQERQDVPHDSQD